MLPESRFAMRSIQASLSFSEKVSCTKLLYHQSKSENALNCRTLLIFVKTHIFCTLRAAQLPHQHLLYSRHPNYHASIRHLPWSFRSHLPYTAIGATYIEFFEPTIQWPINSIQTAKTVLGFQSILTCLTDNLSHFFVIPVFVCFVFAFCFCMCCHNDGYSRKSPTAWGLTPSKGIILLGSLGPFADTKSPGKKQERHF